MFVRWRVGGAMGSGRNLGRSLTMGPNKYSTQTFSSILSLACLCASKEMYPVKTERPMYTSACDASVGLAYWKWGRKKERVPQHYQVVLHRRGCQGCIEPEMTDTVTMN